MASLLEILDFSNFKYDSTLGLTMDDSGSGPPIYFGWIRTGSESNADSQIPGKANCFVWTSDTVGDYGTVAFLAWVWNDPPKNIMDPWSPQVEACHDAIPVWCVQD
jgi:hypothetical protein